ncbi:MAG: purine-nucleoside phosphorylase [Pseudomonadota bacterium]
MTPHISAAKGEIAETLLLPGDPLRAEWIAETFFEEAVCFNKVRGMLGFTGTHQGRKVSVMGSGMGQASLSIYVHELLNSYGVKTIIRVGSCGGFADGIALNDVVIATAASTDSAINLQIFGGITYAPAADFHLVRAAVAEAERRGTKHLIGPIFASDRFYVEEEGYLDQLKAHGVLAVEMESSALYTLAARFGARALTVLTVSDVIGLEEQLSAEERQASMSEMVEIALAAARDA